ncbi:MAG: orotate phosphoribosyltransferase [Tepidisphaeraceae bacterium]
MQSSKLVILKMLGARRGHFLLESGRHGELWLNLDGFLRHPGRLKPLASAIARRLKRCNPDAVCGPMIGGEILARIVAETMGIRCFHVERIVGRSAVRYRIRQTDRRTLRGLRVVVLDDVINAGSAAQATLRELKTCGALPIALSAILVLGPAASHLAKAWRIPLVALHRHPCRTWDAYNCPLCAEQVPLAHELQDYPRLRR